MHSLIFIQSAIVAMSLMVTAGIVHADSDSMQTGWLELVKGSRGDMIGAEVVEIEEGDSADMQKVTVTIPKTSLDDPGDIEEVLVVGKKLPEAEKPKPVEFTYEWVRDYDNDNYGLVIRLSKDTNWPIRLYMNSEAGFVR